MQDSATTKWNARWQGRLQLRLSERRTVLMVGEAISILVAILLALRIWAWVGARDFDLAFLIMQANWFVFLPLLWFVLASANDFYELAVLHDRRLSVQRLGTITVQMWVIYLVVFFLSERDSLPRLFIVYYGGVSFVLVGGWRLVSPALLGWTSAARRVLIVGTDRAARLMLETLREMAPQSYDVVGLIGEARDAEGAVIGTGRDLRDIAMREDVRELVITTPGSLDDETFRGVMDAYERGVVITPMPLLYERLTGRVPVEHVGDGWALVLPIDRPSTVRFYMGLKRVGEVVVAGVGLLVFAGILPFIALALWLDSPGSIFYTQERVGYNGRIFTIIKLRTMIPDAEKGTGAAYAVQGDARITRVGRFLRKTRLDELPQLWNILKGDMSLIGPRPERPVHVQRLQEKIPFYRTRHIIRPGVTGWAQVRYAYTTTDEGTLVKLQHDLYYIRHQSLWLDINILVRTVGKVLRMSGQ